MAAKPRIPVENVGDEPPHWADMSMIEVIDDIIRRIIDRHRPS